MIDEIDMQTIEDKLTRIERRGAELHGQIQKLVAERNMLRAALIEAEEALEDYVDIKDGPDGEPLPNRAMSAVTEIRIVLYGRPY